MPEPNNKKFECVIRRYSPQDYEVVKILIKGLAELYNDTFDEAVFKAYIQSQVLDPSKMIIVAELNHKVVGCTLADTDRDPRGVLYGRISNVNISPEAQGKGIGGALVDKAVAFLTNLEVPSIWANVNPKNDHMIKLFEQRKFNRMLKVMERPIVLNSPMPQVVREKNSVKYREAEDKDFPAVKSLIKTLSDLLNEGFDPYWFDLTIEKDMKAQDSCIFVAEEKGDILGSLFVEKIQDAAGNIRGYISNVMINESARGKGVGSQLILLALEYLQKHKMQKVWANVIYENKGLQKLFETLEFKNKFTVMVRRAKFYNVAFFDAMT